MQRFLCWDEKDILKQSNVSVLTHKPEKKNLALFCRDRWEGIHNGYGGIIQVDGIYRLYYRACGPYQITSDAVPQDNKTSVCVAESADGIHFTKPIVGRYEVEGSTQNNIVFRREGRLDTFTVFLDPKPDCPGAERFKAFARDCGKEFMDLYVSADGYDFSFVERVDLKGTFDTYNVVFYDEDTQEYRLYFRGFHHKDGGDAFGKEKDLVHDIRDVRLAVSKDFRHWDYRGRIAFEEGQEDLPLYTNQIMRYYRKPDILIGFPVRYTDRVQECENFRYMPQAEEREAIIKKSGRTGTALTDCVIMTSRDGMVFDRRENAFLTSGIENGANWWYGDCYTVYGLVETEGEEGAPNEISFYVGENYRCKNVDFRRYTVRLDGFFSWYASDSGGEVVTKPFVLKHGDLKVNFETSARGGLTVEVLDGEGSPLEGYKSYTAFGNSVERLIAFEKSLAPLVGKEISLRFTLRDCHLYSYTFE